MLKFVILTVPLLFYTASAVSIPAGIGASIAETLPHFLSVADFNAVNNHGCWCAKLESNNDNYSGGQDVLDGLDGICRDWFKARRCLRLEGGSCYQTPDDSFTFTTDLKCTNAVGACQTDSCLVNKHFGELISGSLPGSYITGDNTKCPIGTSPGQKSYCTGTAPNLSITSTPPTLRVYTDTAVFTFPSWDCNAKPAPSIAQVTAFFAGSIAQFSTFNVDKVECGSLIVTVTATSVTPGVGTALLGHLQALVTRLGVSGSAIVSSTGASTTANPHVSTDGCGTIGTESQGLIQSPNYPNNYGPDRACSWVLSANNPNAKFEIAIDAAPFGIEWHPSCVYDYLNVEGVKYCGDTATTPASLPRVITTASNTATIKFKSDGGIDGAGFQLTYRAVSTCPAPLAGSTEYFCGGFMKQVFTDRDVELWNYDLYDIMDGAAGPITDPAFQNNVKSFYFYGGCSLTIYTKPDCSESFTYNDCPAANRVEKDYEPDGVVDDIICLDVGAQNMDKAVYYECTC